MESPSEQHVETGNVSTIEAQNQDAETGNVSTIETQNQDTPIETQNVDSENKSPPTQKNKRDKTRSFVWDHFKKLDNDRAECKYCNKTYAANTKLNGTSSMKTHLEMQCKSYPYKNPDKKQKTLSWEPSGHLKATAYNVEECRKEVARMVIIDELPFRHVEAEGFKRLCYQLEPRFIVPSRMTVARDVMKIFVEEKGNLKKKLASQRVCLTTDTWTSIQNINYMCVTAHWIDEDWKIQKRIINFFQVPDHKGETVGKFIEKCLLDWGIEKQFAPFDILDWWKVNSPRYPILSQVAREILAIPVSTVASESAFSTSGRILDPFRSSLSPTMVETLVCTQNWIRKIPQVIDLQEVMDDLGKYDDISKEFKCLTPGLDDE